MCLVSPETANAFSTAIIATFTIVTTICLIVQVQTSRNAERAWILVESAAIDSLENGKVVIRPLVKNSGRTAARIVKISLGGTRPLQFSEKLQDPPVFEGNQELNFVLSPKGQFLSLYAPVVPIHRENMRSVEDGMLKMCVYGLIEYLDFNQKKRVTGFCLIYNRSTDRIPAGFYPYLEAPLSYHKAT